MEKILLILLIYLGLSTSIISQNGNPALFASSESQGILAFNDPDDDDGLWPLMISNKEKT